MRSGTVDDEGSELVLTLSTLDPEPAGDDFPDVPERRWDARIDRGILATALLVGVALRVLLVDSVGLNSDEAVYSGQAASLANNPHFTGLFPVVRAHPLLFQLLSSPLYRSGVPDQPGRYLSAAFGVGTIALVFLLGRVLYSRRVGAIAALLLAVMPYHVIISRQVLLDGPMTFFATACLLCLAYLGKTGRGQWLVAAGACLGLASLTKETAITLLASIFVFLALVPRFWRPARYVIGAGVTVFGLALAYPVITTISGASRSGQSYLLWQLGRQPNHDFGFYLTTIPLAMGVLLLLTAAAGLVLLRHESSWVEVLLLAWLVGPFVFFELWPVKGFPYLLVMTPALAVLAARLLGWLTERLADGTTVARVASWAAVAVVTLSLVVPSVQSVLTPTASGLAGAGGSPGGREAGTWVAVHVPAGARLMTLGPSMGNVIQYYSGHRADGLSVSPNPLHRNPSYQAIPNPDAALRDGDYQFVVWDAYSAARSPGFAAKELALVRKYNGRVVHSESAAFDGTPQPVVVIYQVHP